MAISSEPMATRFLEVMGRRMACSEMGEGPSIVFQHFDPTSRYLWRNIMPELAHLGRCIAVDLLGLGERGQLPDAGPMTYKFTTMPSIWRPHGNRWALRMA